MEDTKDLVSEIQGELQDLTTSLSEVVKSIHELTDPIAESHKKIPGAALQLEKINAQTEEAAHRMIDKTESITRVADEIIGDLGKLCRSIPAEYSEQNPSIIKIAKSIESKVRQNMCDAEVIQIALQFQDITSQQLSYASILIDDIEQKLHNLLNIFFGEQAPERLISLVQKRVFDPNADNNPNEDTQESVDCLVEELKNKLGE